MTQRLCRKLKLDHGSAHCGVLELSNSGSYSTSQLHRTMPNFRGLWEIPLEAVYLDHSTAPCGLNKQPLVVISHKPSGADTGFMKGGGTIY